MNILKSSIYGNITVRVVETEEKLGGKYSVQSVIGGQIDAEKDSLTLDAASEVFKQSCGYLSSQKEFSSIGK